MQTYKKGVTKITRSCYFLYKRYLIYLVKFIDFKELIYKACYNCISHYILKLTIKSKEGGLN